MTVSPAVILVSVDSLLRRSVKRGKWYTNSTQFSFSQVQTAVQCFDIVTNDDRILHCCLVYKQKTAGTSKKGSVLLVCVVTLCFLDKVVLLFTNDTNLCSKAIVCNVAVGNRKVTTHSSFLHSFSVISNDSFLDLIFSHQ